MFNVTTPKILQAHLLHSKLAIIAKWFLKSSSYLFFSFFSTNLAKNIVDVLIAAGNFKVLVMLLTNNGLVNTLRSQGAQTIFAPSDEVFVNLPTECLDKKDENATLLRHVLGGNTVLAADVTQGPVETLSGEDITLSKTSNGGVVINYLNNLINVVTADIKAINGVIHVIDQVILPCKFSFLSTVCVPLQPALDLKPCILNSLKVSCNTNRSAL